MPVVSVPHAFNEDELYVDLRSIFGHSLYVNARVSTSLAPSSSKRQPRWCGPRSGTAPCNRDRS
jgi:hypothetical protein